MKENCDVLEQIITLFDVPSNYKEIEDFLSSNSNLPGPRGNLTLAYKFADCFEHENIRFELVALLFDWANIAADEVPTNDPREFLPFCGILALGVNYNYAEDKTKKRIMNQFKTAMNDTRWRTREGVAMGLQKIAEKDFSTIEKYFSRWYGVSNYLEKRAFIATLAHPPILVLKDIARYSLKMSEDILNDILDIDAEIRRSEEYKVLSKGLQYAISVFVAYLPEEGFDLLKKYAGLNIPDLNKIIKSNLGKTRLSKPYTQKVQEVLAIMD